MLKTIKFQKISKITIKLKTTKLSKNYKFYNY